MWLSIRPWPKAETRAVLQPFNGAILSTTILLLFLQGAYNSTVLQAMLITIPVGLVAAQVGIFVFKRLSDAGFRRPIILSYDFSAEERRFRALSAKDPALFYCPDYADAKAIRQTILRAVRA